ncbi:MAG: hypothetical protein NZ898_16695, partial [Myxococcota bacterium]|nr:hypothetical protein [Myxococcota bacterium]
MDVRTRSIRFALLLVCSPGAACATGGLPEGLAPAPDGTGPAIVWDLEAVPLPVIPLPNDAASWPDPTSPTGLRINASTVATTRLESRLRALYDRLDGWGASMPVTIPFDGPIDVAGLMGRQGPGRLGARAVREHAIYLVDLETGLPVPLDVQTGLNPIVAARTDGYFTGDPRASGSNLLFETVDEDLDDDGRLDPGEDGDLDGVLDEPNTPDGRLDGRPHETVDRLLTFYERQTNTLVLRPLLPLAERRRYAVVVTTRLRGAGGGTVRSPFAWVNPLPQNEVLAALPRIFAAHPDLYGDLAERGFERVAFAWAFTTQSVRADLEAIREGLYGRGPLARLAREFPPVLVPAPLHGGRRPGDCPEPGRMYTITPAELELALGTLASEAFGVSSEQVEALLRTFDAVDYFAIGFFESPYFLGDPDAEHVDETFDVHLPTGRARVRRDLVPMVITVPKPTERARQPFPVTFYAHGYGNLAIESLGFAGLVARQGIATVSIDAQGHGLPLTAAQVTLLEALFDSQCLYPMGRALRNGRARDLNADRSADSAGLFFSAYQFHTRDALRQTVVDWLQAIRVVRHFSGAPGYPDPTPWVPGRIPLRYARGETLAFDGDVDGDGDVDRAGDFDGNGIADFGGWDARYAMWGVSLGGIVTSLVTGFEPAIRTAVPVAGGGGLFDIGLRTDLRTGRDPIWLRVMGPLLIGGPSSGPSSETSCEAGARSLRFEVPDLNQRARVEFACLAPDALQPGDLVVVRNFANRETRCAWAGADGRFGLGIPADEGDPLELSIWRSVTDVDGTHCEVRAGPTEPHVRISTWQVDPPSGSGGCRSCARYQDRTFERGEPLVAPTEGLGLRRQSPELRRLASLAQMALDPADPIHAARHWILDPPTA